MMQRDIIQKNQSSSFSPAQKVSALGFLSLFLAGLLASTENLFHGKGIFELFFKPELHRGQWGYLGAGGAFLIFLGLVMMALEKIHTIIKYISEISRKA